MHVEGHKGRWSKLVWQPLSFSATDRNVALIRHGGLSKFMEERGDRSLDSFLKLVRLPRFGNIDGGKYSALKRLLDCSGAKVFCFAKLLYKASNCL
jgi:hypothetical protein